MTTISTMIIPSIFMMVIHIISALLIAWKKFKTRNLIGPSIPKPIFKYNNCIKNETMLTPLLVFVIGVAIVINIVPIYLVGTGIFEQNDILSFFNYQSVFLVPSVILPMSYFWKKPKCLKYGLNYIVNCCK